MIPQANPGAGYQALKPEIDTAVARVLSVPRVSGCADRRLRLGAWRPPARTACRQFGDAATFSFYPTKNLGALGGAVAFVSGRVVSDIDLVFSPLLLPAVGGHGAELRIDLSTDRGVAPPPLPGPIKRDFAIVGKLGRGVLVEDKGYALALHYRLAPELGPKVIATAQAIQERLPAGAVELILGKFVVEVKPAGLTKATGVEYLMSQKPFHGRRPIFIGDDVTDETVFPILPNYRGFGFSVGRRIAGTDGCFDDPRSVRHWLARAAHELVERSAAAADKAPAYQQ